MQPGYPPRTASRPRLPGDCTPSGRDRTGYRLAVRARLASPGNPTRRPRARD